MVIILASGSEVRGFDRGRGRWIFSDRKNREYDFCVGSDGSMSASGSAGPGFNPRRGSKF